jgi:hypothetical protein
MNKNTITLIIFIMTIVTYLSSQLIVPVNGSGYFDRGDWTNSEALFGLPHRASATEGNIAKFTPKLTKSGTYKISMLGVPVNYTLEVIVYHNGKRENLSYTSKSSDLLSNNYTIGSSQGYDFDATGNEFVGVYIKPNSSWIRIRGVAFDLIQEKTVTKPVLYADSTFYEANEKDQLDVTASPGFQVSTTGWKFSYDPLSPVAAEPKHIYSVSTNEEIATWKPSVTHTGSDAWVKVYAYTVFTPRDLESANVTYNLYFPSNGSANKSVTFSSSDGTGWKHLGDFQFSGKADEYIEVKRQAGTASSKPTRISCIKYELWAPGQGGVNLLWQTLYVNANDATVPVVVPSVNLTNLEGNPNKYFIEMLANKQLISYNEQNNSFDSNEILSLPDFIAILDYALKKQTKDSRIVSLIENLKLKYASLTQDAKRIEAVSLLINEIIPFLPQNKEWGQNMISDLSSYTDYTSVRSNITLRNLYTDATKLGILNRRYFSTLGINNTLNREYAVLLLKGLLETYFWSLPPVKYNWKLRFQEEFNNSTTFWETWKSESGCPGHITSGRFPENISIGDGKLKILVKNEIPARSCGDGKSVEWTTGSVGNISFKQRYGYWEARYKYIDATSLNQSFWMNSGLGFEIDINEGHFPNKVNTTLHYNDNGVPKSNGNSNIVADDLSKDFHTYACYWRPDSIFYYVDNTLLAKKKSYNAQGAVFPIFSLAILPWAGAVKQEMSGKTMDVEWVRVYTVDQSTTLQTSSPLNLVCNGLRQPVTVLLKDENGKPLAGRPVEFANTRKNDANIIFDGPTTINTNEQGLATTYIKGGRFAGSGKLSINVENNEPVFLDVVVSDSGEEFCLPVAN